MKTLVGTCICFLLALAGSASAQENTSRTPSICQAIATHEMEKAIYGGWPGLSYDTLNVTKASLKFSPAQSSITTEVEITYVGHSTFRIVTPDGVTIATDFAGFAGLDIIPKVVTMNHAHGTHFTIAPDSRIDHVLRGWGTDGKPAKHHKQIEDVLVRNVTTDIINQWVGYEPDGNSIFIFEAAGLCIGHLGHLHQLPSDDQYIRIGRLDVLMVPVDGGYTMSVKDMSSVVKRVNASLILPMHWFGSFSLGQFTEEIKTGFPVKNHTSSKMAVSHKSLPVQPTVVVMRPESSFGLFGVD